MDVLTKTTPYWQTLLLLGVVLQIFDALATVFVLQIGVWEANPLLARLLESHDQNSLWLSKGIVLLLIAVPVSLEIRRFGQPRQTCSVLWFNVTVMSAVTSYHLIWIHGLNLI